MIVIDGIAAGHRLCAFRLCPNNPLDYVSQKYCNKHAETHGHLCGVMDCGQPIARNPPGTKACTNSAHQALWAKFRETSTRESYNGLRRIVRQERAELSHGIQTAREPWIATAKAAQAEARAMQVPDDPETTIPHHHRDSEPTLSTPAASAVTTGLKHSWSYRRIHVIEVATWPCGCPIAWAKFSNSESPTNIIEFLTQLFPTPESRPTFITIDKACRVLASLQARGLADHWFQTSRFLVDLFHFLTHKEEPRCQKYCNPSPMDGSQPNLITPILGGDEMRLQRNFDTEASEHLNSFLVNYGRVLSHMRSENHDFLLQVMLEHRFQMRETQLRQK